MPIIIITQDAQNDVLSYFWVLLNTVVKKKKQITGSDIAEYTV